jgi:AcrR family transcriptional regulator
MCAKLIDREQKIQDISQAALKLFSQKGFAATSVGQIAQAASIGKGTIYEYFNTKEDIFLVAVSAWSEHERTQISKMLVGIDDPVERLFAFANRNINIFDLDKPAENRLFIEILQQTFMEGGAFCNNHNLVTELGEMIRQILVDILLDGISKGIFKPEIARDAGKLANNLLAYLDGIGLHSMIAKKATYCETQVKFYLKNLLSLILVDPAGLAFLDREV